MGTLLVRKKPSITWAHDSFAQETLINLAFLSFH